MALVLKLLSTLAAALPAFLEWLSKRKAAQTQMEVQERIDIVRSNPTDAWMRKFNPTAGSGASCQTGTDQSGGNPRRGHHDEQA